MLKVGYDAQAFLSSNGGTGKGLQLRNLLGPFADRFTGFASTDPNPAGLKLVQEGAAGYNLWQQTSLPGSLRRHKIDLFLAPYNTAPFYVPSRVELVLVLHDMILMKSYRKPDLHGRVMDFYKRRQIPASVKRSRVVLTVSEHARGEILEVFPRANVQVIPCSIPLKWFAPQPLEGREGYLLMVTSSAPHKNAAGAIEAYARYAQNAGSSARPLKIVGLSRQADFYKASLNAFGVSELVSFLPFVTEDELIGLYGGAAALLFPSFAEGFGIPMLESMATGTPAIAARAASLPEVGGDAGYYFDPKNVEDMASALEAVLSNTDLQAEMARKGLQQVQLYHPSVIGRQVTDFWKETAGIS